MSYFVRSTAGEVSNWLFALYFAYNHKNILSCPHTQTVPSDVPITMNDLECKYLYPEAYESQR